MTTLIWIFVVYLLSVLLSAKFVLLGIRKLKDEKQDDFFYPFNPKFVGWVVSFIPVVNLYMAWHPFIEWFLLARKVNKIKPIVKKLRDQGEVEAADLLDSVIKQITEHNKLDRKDE